MQELDGFTKTSNEVDLWTKTSRFCIQSNLKQTLDLVGIQMLLFETMEMDDLLIFSSCPSQLKDFYTGMTEEFKMR